MKKLLYITVNPKPEQMSTSKIVGRQFVNRFLEEDKEYVMEELDLYKEDIPEVNHILFSGRAQPVSGDTYNVLSEQDKKQVDRINALCDQFIAADTYVIAAPMWSVSFPSRLKRYFDCIILNNKVIKVSPEDVQGLLDDKERNMIYIQSSGGVYPKLFNSKINHGVEYVEDIFKFLGIHKFKKILVEGVDVPDVGREAAISNAFADVEAVVDALTTDKLIQI